MRNPLNLRMLVGTLLIVAGVGVLLMDKIRIPFGRLPGDIAYRGKNFAFYFPLASSILISVILSLLFYLIARFRR